MANGPEKHAPDSPLQRVQDSINKVFGLFSERRANVSANAASSLTEKNETNDGYESFFHALGKFELKALPKLSENKSYAMVGSVDRSIFSKRSREKDMVREYEGGKAVEKQWHDSIAMGASLLYSLMEKGRVKIDFPSLAKKDSAEYKKMRELVYAISSMKSYTDAGFNEAVKGFSDEEIYGPEGVLNLILAFKRATATVDPNEIDKDANFKSTNDNPVPKFLEIQLKIGQVTKSDKDRYSLLINTDRKTAAKQAPAKPPVAPPPAPAKPPVAPPPAPAKPPVVPPPAPAKPPVVPPPAPVKPPVAPPPAPVKPPVAPAEPKPVAKPQPKPEVVTEAPSATIAAMAKALEDVKFKFFTKPTAFVESPTGVINGYVKYKEKSIAIAFHKDGTYSFNVQSLFDKNPNKVAGIKQTLQQMKATLDAMPEAHNDPVKALLLDLKNVPGYNVKLEGPLTKDAQGDNYDDNTYKVTIQDHAFKKANGEPAKLTTSLIVKINASSGYKVEEFEFGRISPTDNAKEFLKDAVEKAVEKNGG